MSEGTVGVGGRASAGPGLRLTTRGRVVILALLVIVALACAVLAAGATNAADRPHPAPTQRVTVRAGQSLWGIAVERFPRRDPRTVIAEITKLSHLSENAVQPGQELVLPAA